MIELGSEVKDTISGVKGIAVARTCWLHGCVRLTIQQKVGKDGKVPEPHTTDEPQCEVLKLAKKKAVKPRHGDRPNAAQHAGPVR